MIGCFSMHDQSIESYRALAGYSNDLTSPPSTDSSSPRRSLPRSRSSENLQTVRSTSAPANSSQQSTAPTSSATEALAKLAFDGINGAITYYQRPSTQIALGSVNPNQNILAAAINVLGDERAIDQRVKTAQGDAIYRTFPKAALIGAAIGSVGSLFYSLATRTPVKSLFKNVAWGTGMGVMLIGGGLSYISGEMARSTELARIRQERERGPGEEGQPLN